MPKENITPRQIVWLLIICSSLFIGVAAIHNISLDNAISEVEKNETIIEEQKEKISEYKNQLEYLNQELSSTIKENNGLVNELETLSLEMETLETNFNKVKQANLVKIASSSKQERSDWIKGWNLTYYSLNVESTGKTPDDPGYGITKSGNYVKENHTIACPPMFPLGTKIEIDRLGIRVCDDRGSAITDARKRLDVYLPNRTNEELLKLGVTRNVQIRVLE